MSFPIVELFKDSTNVVSRSDFEEMGLDVDRIKDLSGIEGQEDIFLGYSADYVHSDTEGGFDETFIVFSKAVMRATSHLGDDDIQLKLSVTHVRRTGEEYGQPVREISAVIRPLDGGFILAEGHDSDSYLIGLHNRADNVVAAMKCFADDYRKKPEIAELSERYPQDSFSSMLGTSLRKSIG